MWGAGSRIVRAELPMPPAAALQKIFWEAARGSRRGRAAPATGTHHLAHHHSQPFYQGTIELPTAGTGSRPLRSRHWHGTCVEPLPTAVPETRGHIKCPAVPVASTVSIQPAAVRKSALGAQPLRAQCILYSIQYLTAVNTRAR